MGYAHRKISNIKNQWEVKMKRLFLIVCTLIATIIFLGISAQSDTFVVNRVIEVPGSSKEVIFDKASIWSERYLRDYKADKGSGVILANGEIAYPSPTSSRIQYTFVFKMKNTVQDNRVAATFEGVMLKSPETYLSLDTGAVSPFIGGETTPVESRVDIEAASNSLNLVADNLEAYLKGKSDAACPLMKCPECPLLGTSSEEMKDHMKRHEHMKGNTGQETAPKR
jgi:hypothetical protein